MDELIKLISQGWSINIYHQTKRMDDGRGYRDFIARVCWEASFKDTTLESVWEGFGSPSEAIQDLLKKCNG